MYNSPYYYPAQRKRITSSSMGSARPAASRRATPLEQGGDGFLSNLDAGQIASAVTGAAGLATNAIGMANQSLGIETQAPAAETSATGEPIYNVGDFQIQANAARPQGVTGGEAIGGFTQGAAAGAPFGLPGMAVGGLIGLGTAVFGGNARRKKQAREKRRALRSVSEAQKAYNKSSLAFDASQASMEDYYNRLDMSDRLYNLYK